VPEIHVTLPDGSERRLPAGATGADLAQAIGPGLAKAALAVRVDGQVWDLARPLPDGMRVAIVTDRDTQALDVLRHSCAHVLATAVRDVGPDRGAVRTYLRDLGNRRPPYRGVTGDITFRADRPARRRARR